MRPIPQAAIDMERHFEGTRLIAYRDACGYWTIGTGHLITKDLRAPQPPAIDQATSDRLLAADTARTGASVETMIPADTPDPQLAALIDFAFNLGAGALKGSRLRARLLAGDVQGAADEFPKWCHAGGRKLQGLLVRRLAERALFLSQEG